MLCVPMNWKKVWKIISKIQCGSLFGIVISNIVSVLYRESKKKWIWCIFFLQLSRKYLYLYPLRKCIAEFFKISESSSVGRAQPCQGWGREFESRLSLNGENRFSSLCCMPCRHSPRWWGIFFCSLYLKYYLLFTFIFLDS